MIHYWHYQNLVYVNWMHITIGEIGIMVTEDTFLCSVGSQVFLETNGWLCIQFLHKRRKSNIFIIHPMLLLTVFHKELGKKTCGNNVLEFLLQDMFSSWLPQITLVIPHICWVFNTCTYTLPDPVLIKIQRIWLRSHISNNALSSLFSRNVIFHQ
jgi:hypothetical protein